MVFNQQLQVICLLSDNIEMLQTSFNYGMCFACGILVPCVLLIAFSRIVSYIAYFKAKESFQFLKKIYDQSYCKMSEEVLTEDVCNVAYSKT